MGAGGTEGGHTVSVQTCPSCDVDITAMDAQGFVDHMHDAHPDTYDLFKRVFASFGEDKETQ
jgi:hypothetical protein